MTRTLLAVLVTAPLLTACARPDPELASRVEALEARYHTQQRKITALESEVAALKSATPDAAVAQ